MAPAFTRPSLYLPRGTSPPQTGAVRNLPELVDYNSIHNPDYVFCYQARKDGTSTQLLTITHRQLRDAVLRCQSWLRNTVPGLQLPKTSDAGVVTKGPPVALLMESDVGLWVHKLALLGLGVPALLLSARLSSNAVRHLLNATGAGAVVASARLRATAEEAIGQLQTEKLPTLYERLPYDTFLEDGNGTAVPGSEDSVCVPGFYQGEKDREAIILHSSGTTGLPKPIYHTHEYLVGFAAAHDFGVDEEVPRLNFSTLPLYHGFGLVAPCLSMSVGLTLGLPVTTVSSGSTIIELLHLTNASSLMTVPSTLEDISLIPDDEGIRGLQPMKFVAFGGGALKASVGERLAANGVALLNHYGATEIGALAPIFVPRPESNYDYRFFRLRKDFNLQLISVDSPDAEEPLFKLVAHPFGWEGLFEVQDELVCNPKNPTSDFNAIGRKDDLIVLATGEKVLPNILETFVSENKHCKVAIAFGQNQFNVGLLVEPAQEITEEDYDTFRDTIWPTIEQANDMMDSHGRISSKKAIAIVPPHKSIPRTDKGSVMRQEVYKIFAEEITQTYKELEDDSIDGSLPPLDMNDLETGIKLLIQDRLGWKVPSDKWTYEDDLFDLGMDSLQALQLRRFLISVAPGASSGITDAFPRDFVYRNPSVLQLAAAIRGSEGDQHDDLIDRYCQMYSAKALLRDGATTPTEGSVILLTGSTGSLGSHLLEYLANMPTVYRVICLNRPQTDTSTSPEDRLLKAMKSKGIVLSEPSWSKVQVFQTNLSEPYLGLGEDEYNSICASLTHVIHNAWPMDFNRLLPSFETQFRILSNLITLSRDAHGLRPAVKPTVLFVSSIAVVGQYPSLYSERIVPEIPMTDNRCADEFGYAKAKLVCERMIEGAADIWGKELNAKYVRVGQMTGAMGTGLWNTTEHFPALVKSSLLIGALPQLAGTLSWLPVDFAARAVVDILFASTSATNSIAFHLENPIRQAWHDVLSALASELGLPESNWLPYDQWLARVLAVEDDKMDENPAKKLAGFFEGDFEHMASGEVVMDTTETRRVSKTIRELGGVDEALIKKYVAQWRSVGFLP